jgi:hypothetical protein
MKEYVGYPDWILNRTTLESAYSGVWQLSSQCIFYFIFFSLLDGNEKGYAFWKLSQCKTVHGKSQLEISTTSNRSR